MNIIGIDPGIKGGIALISLDQLFVLAYPTEKYTDYDLDGLVKQFKSMGSCYCFIEKVGAARGQGVASMFTFGDNAGFWRGLIVANQIPFEYVPPTVWQPALRIKPRRKDITYNEHKKLLKEHAQRIYPGHDITLATADAILIAEYGRRIMLANRLV